MPIQIKKLNNAIKVGFQLPKQKTNGDIGRWVEDKLEKNGYTFNRGMGPDLPELGGIEVKTRQLSSTSGHTVGAMSVTDIVDTPWKSSNFHKKIQKQYRVYYDDYNIVKSEAVYDFSDSDIQNLLEESYEAGRTELSMYADMVVSPKYIRGENCIAYFEYQEASGQYQFRLSNNGMQKIETMAQQTFNNLFEIE